MKAAFITVHVGFNFGSKLQAIATQEVLKRVGCDEVICVNYIPPRVTFRRYWKIAFQNPIRLIRRLLYLPFHLYSIHQFDGYLKRHCNLSKPIYDDDDFCNMCPISDVYISGSDQIWNYKHNEGIDRHYFFDGVEGKKIAYASSIGMVELPQEYVSYMKEQLKNYSSISVREDSAVLLLKEWGLLSTHVIDPTLMLNKDEWFSYASKRKVNEPYLFVYLPYNIADNDTINQTISLIAGKKNLKVVSYSDGLFKERAADKTIKFVTPGDILSLIYYADVIVTNSFHGTAFSINLNKQFWVYMPSKFSTRIDSILDLCSLRNRLLKDVINENLLFEEINYTKSNSILSEERAKAFDFLIKAIK